MTRLTLEWHLRGIIGGTTDPECVQVNVEWSNAFEKFRPSMWTEEDPRPSREYRDGSYTTGFERENGRFCDALDVPAREALASGDPVRFLDAVAHDPRRRFQERNDAAWLLDKHIWPDSPRAGTDLADIERADIDLGEWYDAGMVRQTHPPIYLPMKCAECREEECLFDPDILRDEDRAVCMTCGTEQPIPEYP